jgi:hypothetical protein
MWDKLPMTWEITYPEMFLCRLSCMLLLNGRLPYASGTICHRCCPFVTVVVEVLIQTMVYFVKGMNVESKLVTKYVRWWSFENVMAMKNGSSGKLRRVALVRTDVSEELSASFIMVARIGGLGTTLALTSNRRTLHSLHRLLTHSLCISS